MPPPKRPAEDIIRAQLQGMADVEPSSKKPRFDYRNPSTLAQEAPEEDAILELDEIGKGGLQSKRNAVKLDGYESDSSNENFDARADAKAEEARLSARSKKSKDEEEADMFADLEEDMADGDDDEELEREGKKRKKNVKFIDQAEIEGQVMSSKSGGHVSADFTMSHKGSHGREADSSSESGDDEERDKVDDDMDNELGAGSKKHHAPKLDAFNMRNEAEEGRFDESGNFVRNAADPMAVHDAWLEDSSKSDIKKAKEAHDKREAERREKDMAEDAVPTSQALSNLIGLLQNGETALEALARLGSSKAKKKPKWQRNKRKNEPDMDVDDSHDAADDRRKGAVEELTSAADILLSRDQPEIYDTERSLLMRMYKRETGDDWKEADPGADSEPAQWEYRWADARDGGEVHGPYDGPTMVAWNEAGYFGEGVEFRHAGTTDSWRADVDFV